VIPIQNIYYMLAYSFQPLREKGYKKVATEHFDNATELCAAILIRGVSLQLKQGLGRDYIPETETLSEIKGKINFTESIKTQALLRKQMVCTYDDFSVNTYMNQIIKTTLQKLLLADINKAQKKAIKKLLVFFSDVQELDVYSINWNLNFVHNNQTYEMLVSICYLLLKGLLQTQSNGNTKLMDFTVEQKHRLYERFILGYYKTEHPELTAKASQVPWQVDDGFTSMLPIMQTDISLEHNGTVLIIDAKYYEHTTQVQYDKHTIHSHNLYQIFTYVKNKEYELRDTDHKVSGMLLYAKTDEEILPNNIYQMSGNQITVKTLDLNLPLTDISTQLDEIARSHFSPKEYAYGLK
jgi:5-methylcytosine-specific restriction enzyme subunit McrC